MIVTDYANLSLFVSLQERKSCCYYCVFILHHRAAFLLILLTVFIQVVECIAESLSILETPLQVKVRRHITLSFRRLYNFFELLPLDW